MNDDTYGGELHAWIEPEIEARIVAMILGEASDFEIDQLERLMDERPELRIFMRRLEVVHGLMGDALKAEDDEKWRLAPQRRAEVMKAIGVAPAHSEQDVDAEDVLVLPIDDARERRVRRAGLKVAMMAAACLVISVVIAPLFIKFGSKNGAASEGSKLFQKEDSEAMAPTIVSYNSSSSRESELPAARGIVLERSGETDGRFTRSAGDGKPGDKSYWYRNGRQIADESGSAHDKLAALKKSIGTASEAIAVTEYDPPEIVDSETNGVVMNGPVPSAAPVSGPVAKTTTVAGELARLTSETAPVPDAAPAPSEKPVAPPAMRTPVKPSASAPSSSMAKVTAAITPAPTAIPVPGAEKADGVPMLADIPMAGRLFENTNDSFGSEDDFGSGWGNGGGGGGGGGFEGDKGREMGGGSSGGVPLTTKLPPELLEGTPSPILSLQIKPVPEPAPPGEPVVVDFIDRLESEKLAMDDFKTTNTRQSGSSDSSWAYDGKDAEKDALLRSRGAPLGTTGAIAGGSVSQTNAAIEPDYDQRANANHDGEVAAAEAMLDLGEAGNGERFKMQVRAGTELGAVKSRGRGEAVIEEGLAVDEKSKEGREDSRRGIVKREDGRSGEGSMLIPARQAAPADPAPADPAPDDDIVWTDSDMPADAPAQVRIETKHLEVRQSNIEELDLDWGVQDEGKKANLKQNPGDELFFGGGTLGVGAGDRAQSHEAIDANPDQSGPAPGILSPTGLFDDEQVEQIQRALKKGGLKRDLTTSDAYGIADETSALNGVLPTWGEGGGGPEGEIVLGDASGYAGGGEDVSGDHDGDGFMDYAFESGVPHRDGQAMAHGGNQSGQESAGSVPGSIREREALRRKAKVADADESLPGGRDASAKNDGETRGRKLAEVDEESEMAVPPEESKKGSVDEAGLLEVPQTQQELVEKRLGKMAQVVIDRRDESVDRALESHYYIESNRRSNESRGGTAYLSDSLKDIIIPEIDFEDTTVEEALDFLRQRARELDTNELDPDKKGVNFVLRKARVDGPGGLGADAELDAEGDLGSSDPGSARIKNLKLKNVSLGDALKHIEDQTGLRHKVDDYAVTLLPSGGSEGQDLLTRRWNVPASFVKDIQTLGEDENGESDPFGGDLSGSGLRARRPMVDVLKASGIRLPEGASAAFLPGSNTLVVKSTPSELDKMDQIVEQIGDGSPPIDYMGLYEPLDSSGQLDQSDARDEIVMKKLKNIRIPVVDFDGTTVEDAVEFIRQRTRELDVADAGGEAAGIDFSIRKARIDTSARGFDAELDAEGLRGPSDPGQAQIRELKLRNVPVGVVLQYVADQAGLRYRVKNGTVEFLPVSGGEGEDVTSRAWKIHPDVIAQLQKGSGNDSVDDDPFADVDPFAKVENSLARMLEERPLIDLMKESGISFPEGAAVSYLPDSQVLVVKNTPSNMDLVDALMEAVAGALAQERQAVKANEKTAAQEAFSTFSLNVSDVSFKLALASLAKGEWPDALRVRVEEFVNAFDYGDPAPSQKEKVACQVEQAAHPFMQQRNMLRISMRTAALGRASGTPLRLTVLLDNSGSMERADRVESVQRAFQLLAAQLHPEDEITLISFARTPRLLRDRVSGDKAMELARVIAETPSEGGTNLEEALRLGVEKATERMLEGAQNRIILLTDGAANLGNAEPEELAGLVEQMRQKGIAFDACGVGAEGLNDDVLEALTRKGDGRYYFLNRPEDADAGFAKQIAGALRPAAKNVKVQVEFNPKRVGHYRLYGFEKHILKKEDFRNDSVDAAELAAEEAGVAMYQVEPLPDGEGDIGTVSVRFQDMATGEMVEKLWPIPYEVAPARLAQAAPTMQLAASAAFLGEKLKGSPIGEVVELAELSGLSRGLQTVYPSNERVGHLVDMIEKAREMTR